MRRLGGIYLRKQIVALTRNRQSKIRFGRGFSTVL